MSVTEKPKEEERQIGATYAPHVEKQPPCFYCGMSAGWNVAQVPAQK
jgi:hypothetical protein